MRASFATSNDGITYRFIYQTAVFISSNIFFRKNIYLQSFMEIIFKAVSRNSLRLLIYRKKAEKNTLI